MSLRPEWQQRLTRLVEIAIGVIVLVAALSLWRWYQEGGGFEVIYVVIVAALTGLWAVRRWLQPAETTAPTSSPSAWGMVSLAADESLISLRQQLEAALTLDDLRLLAFHLNLNYDNLAGETLTRKILALLQWCGVNGRFPDLITYLQATYPRREWAPPTLPALTAHPRGQRNRENLLNHIQTTWIDGFLKQSIHSEVLKLALNYRPEAVGQRPWQLVLQQTGQADQPVPPDRSILHIFNGSGRNLLILGAPGSGKTITMLQLAEALIASARTNPAEPMPIVLNLSSWAREKRPLTEWLVEEMFVQYGVARNLTRAGVADNLFLYLLDGLDEVASEARAACLEAINQFKEAHPAEMVVCSRIEEYEALERTLHLGAAVVIRPLSDEQVQSYITQEVLELQAVRATLNQDSDLRELARAPLMLSLMTLAYRGLSRADLQPLADKEARRRHLFDHYVRQMFARRPLSDDTPYTQAQALHWLANLARGMVRHEQSVFYIERLQPTWLPTNRLRQPYQIIIGLIFALIYLVMLLRVTYRDMVYNPEFWLFLVSVLGPSGGLFFWVVGWRNARMIKPVEKLHWLIPSRQTVLFAIKGKLFSGLVNGLVLGLVIAVAGWLIGGGIFQSYPGIISELAGRGFISWLTLGLSWGLISGIVFGLSAVLDIFLKYEEITDRVSPNQGVRHSEQNALYMSLIWALILGLMGGFIGWLNDKSIFWIGNWLLIGIIVGLLLYGGQPFIQHFMLRWFLARAEIVPFPFSDSRYIAFLDAMAGRIFLRRVGGGWIFVHRSLLEYFAGVAVPLSSANKDQ